MKNSKIHHLGSKAVDDKYSEEIELSRNWHWMWSRFYFNKKHRGIFVSLFLGLVSLLGNFVNTIRPIYLVKTMVKNRLRHEDASNIATISV